jgi:hypothetical protein
MSFDPQGRGYGGAGDRKDIRTGSPGDMALRPGLMSERTHLPELDYRALQINSLKRLSKTAKAPADHAAGQRYEALVKYLGQRSGGASQVDAAEVDRRMRTWFEDLINRVLQNPQEWDSDKVLDGKVLMDFLSGVKAGPQPPAPEVPPAR